MVRNLFTEIVYNLDTQRITSFKLKPWADRFIKLRAVLYQEGENKTSPGVQGEGKHMPPTGFEPVFSP